MAGTYWDKILTSRVSRRRALGAAGTFSLSAALLAACGGDGESGPKFDSSGLVSLVGDESKQGKSGGVMSRDHGELEFIIDPISMLAPTNAGIVAAVYSQFVKYGKKVPPEKPTEADIEGDAMSEWEFAPDGMSVTYKLRPNHKFDPRPPTNGRAMTVEDVRWSYQRTEAQSPLGGTVFRSAGEGPLAGIEVVNNNTVKIKTAEPYGATNEVLAYLVQYIAPIEGDGKFDMKREMRGSGPFRLDALQEGVSAKFSKNTDWYVDNRPFLDGMNYSFLSEPAVRNAQFIAKQIWTHLPDNALDTLDIKKRFPEVIMKQESPRLTPASYGITLGTYFQDVRLRRAVSMIINRELMISSVRNTNVWTDNGIDAEIRWDGHLGSQSANWVDPQGTGLGEHAKSFQYNPAEAKKLMDAAGYDGRELTFLQRAAFQPEQTAILSQMIKQGGFKTVDRAVPAAEWRDYKFKGPGSYEGFFFNTYISGSNDEGYLTAKYTEAGRDRVIDKNIAALTTPIRAIRTELDPEKKNQLVKDFQKYLAENMYDVPTMSLQPVLQYDLTWPWLRNNAWVVPGFSFWATSARPYTEFFFDKEMFDKFG